MRHSRNLEIIDPRTFRVGQLSGDVGSAVGSKTIARFRVLGIGVWEFCSIWQRANERVVWHTVGAFEVVESKGISGKRMR